MKLSVLSGVPGIGAKKEAEQITLLSASRSALERRPGWLYLCAFLSVGDTLDKCEMYAFRYAVACPNDSAPDQAKYHW